MSNNGPVGWPTATADSWPPSPQNTETHEIWGWPMGVTRIHAPITYGSDIRYNSPSIGYNG